MKLTKWTTRQVIEFRTWHEKRMVECGYPLSLQEKLRLEREKFLSALESK